VEVGDVDGPAAKRRAVLDPLDLDGLLDAAVDDPEADVDLRIVRASEKLAVSPAQPSFSYRVPSQILSTWIPEAPMPPSGGPSWIATGRR
jgi:hypothetical protein